MDFVEKLVAKLIATAVASLVFVLIWAAGSVIGDQVNIPFLGPLLVVAVVYADIVERLDALKTWNKAKDIVDGRDARELAERLDSIESRLG